MYSHDDPHHIDVREDGMFAGLEDDGKETMGNGLAIIPCDARPDPVVSQCAVAPYAKHMIVTCQTEYDGGISGKCNWRNCSNSHAQRNILSRRWNRSWTRIRQRKR